MDVYGKELNDESTYAFFLYAHERERKLAAGKLSTLSPSVEGKPAGPC